MRESAQMKCQFVYNSIVRLYDNNIDIDTSTRKDFFKNSEKIRINAAK